MELCHFYGRGVIFDPISRDGGLNVLNSIQTPPGIVSFNCFVYVLVRTASQHPGLQVRELHDGEETLEDRRRAPRLLQVRIPSHLLKLF